MNRANKKDITKEVLNQLFNIEKKTCSEISEITNYSVNMIKKFLKMYNIKIPKGPKSPRFDLTGKTINNWRVIGYDGIYKNSTYYWNCECLLCHNIVEVNGCHLRNNKSTKCFKCGRESGSNKNRTGYEEISGSYIRNIKNGAKLRNLEYSITPEYMWKLYLQQNRKCILSGLDLIFVLDFTFRVQQTASLDRIDSSKGYVEGNVQWVHKDINKMKWEFNEDKFINLCHQVANNNPLYW